MEDRKSISSEVFKFWQGYVDKRTKEIPEDLAIPPKVKQNLWSVFNAFKVRNSNKVEGKVMLDFLNEYVKLHRFEMAIDPEILLKQIHPFSGHMTKINKLLSFEEVYSLFEYFCVASFEKLQGQTLLSSEICAFALWKYQDNRGLGQLSFSESEKLLRTFDFELKNWVEFQREFEFAIKQNEGSFLMDEKGNIDSQNCFSFDFFRYIYLERNF